MAWGTAFELERRRRIRVSVLAYAYEIEDDPLATDAEFDALCAQIQPQLPTGNRTLDTFFRTEFQPCTGSWVHRHPDRRKLGKLTNAIRNTQYAKATSTGGGMTYEHMPELDDRERCAWCLYCQAVTIAAKDFWWELSPTVQAFWLAEADQAIAAEAARNAGK